MIFSIPLTILKSFNVQPFELRFKKFHALNQADGDIQPLWRISVPQFSCVITNMLYLVWHWNELICILYIGHLRASSTRCQPWWYLSWILRSFFVLVLFEVLSFLLLVSFVRGHVSSSWTSSSISWCISCLVIHLRNVINIQNLFQI